jgi:hypothetical protein
VLNIWLGSSAPLLKDRAGKSWTKWREKCDKNGAYNPVAPGGPGASNEKGGFSSFKKRMINKNCKNLESGIVFSTIMLLCKFSYSS